MNNKFKDAINEIANYIMNKFSNSDKLRWMQVMSGTGIRSDLTQEFRLKILNTEIVIGYGDKEPYKRNFFLIGTGSGDNQNNQTFIINQNKSFEECLEDAKKCIDILI
jgi:hypothetical protein